MTTDGQHVLTPAQVARQEEWQVAQSVDVHCHCLPGVDDGPETLEDSLDLCRALVADGVTDVLATPHQLGPYDGVNTAAVVDEARRRLQAELDAAGIPLALHPGADVRIDERLCRLIDRGEVLAAGPHRKHLLLELPHTQFLDPLSTIKALGRLGIQTIMTHPERHRYLADSAARFEAWVAAGAAIQITAGSLLGDFGARAEEQAWRLVDQGMVSLVASDAHDGRRPPRLSAALAALSAEVGRPYARAVCLENPLKVLDGELVGACRPG